MIKNKWSHLTEKEWWNRKISENTEWELRKPNRSKAEFHGFKRLFDIISINYDFDEKRVLDVGSGTGWASQWVLERFQPDQIVEYDISEAMVKLSKKRLKSFLGKTAFFVGDIEKMPFRQNSFDVCIVIDTLHHTADPSKALKEIVRISSNLILFEPNKLNPIRRLNERMFMNSGVKETSFLKTDLLKMLVEVGFKQISKVVNVKWISAWFPDTFVSYAKPLEALLEKVPIVKEFSGALLVFAHRTPLRYMNENLYDF